MKKFYAMLMALVCFMVASAADTYQLHSSITGNPSWESVTLTENNGWYEYTGTFVAGEFGIKKNGSWLSGGGANITEADTEVAFSTSGGSNSKSSLAGQYTFGFNPTSGKVRMVTFTGEITVVETYQLRGSLVTGQWEDYDMTNNNGVWSVTLTVKAGQFGLKRNENGSQKDWLAADGTATINAAGDYPAKINGTNWTNSLTGKVTFAYNPTSKVLKVTTDGGNVEPGPIDPPVGDNMTIYWDNSVAKWATPHIHYWGGSSQSTWPGAAMTLVSGDKWKYEVPANTTGCLFNAGDGDATKTGDFTAEANATYNQNGKVQGGTPVIPDDPDPVEGKDLYIVGETPGWSVNAAYKMTRDNNVYTITLPEALEGKWKIWDGTWTYNFGAGETQPVAGTEYDAWFDAADFTVAVAKGAVIKLTVVAGSDVKNSPIPAKLLITENGTPVIPDDPDPVEAKDLYIVGGCNSWSKNEAYKMTRNGNVYTFTVAEAITGQWKIFSGEWTYNFGAGADQPENDVECDAWFDGQKNFEVNLAVGAQVKFTLVEGSDVTGSSIPSKLLISNNSVVAETITYCLHGQLMDGETWQDIAMTEENGCWIADGNFKAGEFGIRKLSNGSPAAWIGFSDLNSCSGAEKAADNSNLYIGQGGNLKITFDPNAMALTVSTNGSDIEMIEAVANAAAIYYNLQGVRVANPEAGLYIRVLDGQVAKVMVK